jgi:hypothetical protein
MSHVVTSSSNKHVSRPGGYAIPAAQRPGLNPFGEAFRLAGHTWTQELCRADSDGDGASNGAELGDPCCVWVQGSPSPVDASYILSHPGYAGARPGLRTRSCIARVNNPPASPSLPARVSTGWATCPDALLTSNWSGG